MFNLIPCILGFHFKMNFTSELELQIWVTLRLLINTPMTHFLHKLHRNQKEFDAICHAT